MRSLLFSVVMSYAKNPPAYFVPSYLVSVVAPRLASRRRTRMGHRTPTVNGAEGRIHTSSIHKMIYVQARNNTSNAHTIEDSRKCDRPWIVAEGTSGEVIPVHGSLPRPRSRFTVTFGSDIVKRAASSLGGEIPANNWTGGTLLRRCMYVV